MRKGKKSEFLRPYLNAAAAVMNDFYLVGGTALSLFYLNHRLSCDLDFFTQNSLSGAKEIRNAMGEKIGGTWKKSQDMTTEAEGALFGETWLLIRGAEEIKFDFVRDSLPLRAPPELIQGIRIAGIDDIYLRKLATTMTRTKKTKIGDRELPARQKARDVLDLYALSEKHISLSNFLRQMDGFQRIDNLVSLGDYFEGFSHKVLLEEIEESAFSLTKDSRKIKKTMLKEVKKAKIVFLSKTIPKGC